MAYDEKLAERIRKALPDEEAITERKMFGGIAFMVNGNMVCGVVREDLMARVGAEVYEDALAKPHTKPMNFSGRPMKGMLYVTTEGYAGKGLKTWIDRCLRFAETLPPKR